MTPKKTPSKKIAKSAVSSKQEIKLVASQKQNEAKIKELEKKVDAFKANTVTAAQIKELEKKITNTHAYASENLTEHYNALTNYAAKLNEHEDRFNGISQRLDSHNQHLMYVDDLKNKFITNGGFPLSEPEIAVIAKAKATDKSQRAAIFGATWGAYASIFLTGVIIGSSAIVVIGGIAGLVVALAITAVTYAAPE